MIPRPAKKRQTRAPVLGVVGREITVSCPLKDQIACRRQSTAVPEPLVLHLPALLLRDGIPGDKRALAVSPHPQIPAHSSRR